MIYYFNSNLNETVYPFFLLEKDQYLYEFGYLKENMKIMYINLE
ncbi:MAG: hypothetical protein BAJALOKI2v1_890004 [Promethearchaeota archaeon]|nr:MAG: hypothetical protein BAJALOKI2v1_890004 [Candidatus Lokiarchaeota archaeon]